VIDWLYLGIYRLFGVVLWIVPAWMVRGLMRGLAWIAYGVSAKHRAIIHHNLDLAFAHTLTIKQKRTIGVEAFVNLIDTLFGIIKRERLTPQEVLENVTFEGEEIVRAYQDQGQKIIFVTGHQGNWELLSQAIALKFDLTLVGVGRKLDSAVMDEVLKANRERFNVEMVYKKGAMKGCLKALSQGKAVGILIDQAIRKKFSIGVKLFGYPATHTPLASILSRKFGVALIPAFIHTDDYINYHVTIYEPLPPIKSEDQERDLIVMTQAQAKVMEQVMRTYPKQWFWMHKRWK